MFDRQGLLVWANHYDEPPEECLGKPAWHWTQDPYRQEMITAMGRVMLSGETQNIEVRSTVANKERLYRMSFSKSPADVVLIAAYREVDKRIELLTARERVVLTLFRTSSPKQIAGLLGISVSTVQTYLTRASEKLGLRGHSLIKWAIENLRG